MKTTRPAGFAGLEPPATWPPARCRPADLGRPVDALPGVGKTIRARLAKLGLRTVRDVLEHAPFRYVGASPISSLFGEGGEVSIEGTVGRVSKRSPRRRMSIVEATVSDESGQIRATWFNQPWVAEQLQPGMRLRLIGTLRRGTFAVRTHELASEHAELVPVYPATEDVTPKKLRELVLAALPREVADPLPAALKQQQGLPSKIDALHTLHRPRSLEEAEKARIRLAFEELLVLQLGIARSVRAREATVATALGEPGELLARYRAALPFDLTEHQERAIAEIDADLAGSVPMQRLLQGDVGSGKTVVALYALLRAVERQRQGALMAPTETLAEQHFLTIEALCAQLGVRVALLTSSVKGDPDAELVVGTHALIQEGIELPRLAVAVIDEQHRFGVEQRKALVEGRSPHVLHMTATPIPRTLALTVYGDLSVTEIAKPPAERKPIVTSRITAERSSEAYMRLRRHLDDGRQAYVVCPLIEETETSVARPAEAEAERLRKGELKGYRVGLLHGRLRPAERRELMAQFKERELDVLVATTVIEVGVDVPNATIMIVQEADRFGLATLHQLRGRVGRGAEQSYCLLISRPQDQLTDSAKERLDALVSTTDGFVLAEKDLEIRGEGQLLGTRQSGLSDLKFTRLRADRPLLERAREAARSLVDVHGPLDDEVDARLAGAGRSDLMRIIAGSRKGHRIDAPKGLATRPTSDRVRENVFNLVQAWVPDAIALDLFAGSGAMGIEALSRGAERAVFVESHGDACRVIDRNLEKLRLTGAQVVCNDVGRFLASDTRAFDLIFCDPPYEEYAALEPQLARYVPRLLAEGGLLVLETAAKTEPELPLEQRTSRRYGAARITLFNR